MAGDVGSSHVRTDFGELSDAELVRATRDGSRRAYAALYARHSVSALKYARTLTSSDADDVVSEAFLKVYSAIKAGRGPEEDFRYYMRSAVRNTYISMVRARRTDPAGDAIEDVVGDRGADVASLRSFDGSATARAFMSLPARWQEVLWYLEVEGYSREHTATLLGMNPNAVSALSFRAREALRTAWLQQHISVHSDLDRGCEAVTPLLGAYSRNGLSRRDRLRVEHHVTGCAHCTSVLEELSELLTPGRLALILLPLALAGGSLAAFASKLGSGAVASGAVASGAVASGVVAPTATATVFATVGGGSTAAGGAAALSVVGKVAACAIVATMIVPPTQMLIVAAQHESITHHRSEISEPNADLGAVLLAGDVDIPVSIAAGEPDAGRVIEADSDTDSEAAEQPEPRGGRPEGAGAPESPAEGNSGPKPDAKPDAAKSNGGGKSEAPPTGDGNPATAPNANANPHATANGKGSGNANPTGKGNQAGAADPSGAGNAGAEVGTSPDTATAPTAPEGNPDVPGPAPLARSAASAAPTTGEATTQAAAPPVAASAATDAVGEAAVASTETVTPSGP